MAKENINNKASYEAYLNDLFVMAVSSHGTPEKSVDEILLETAILYGRAVEEAKEDVKRILNVRNAVCVLLKGVSEKFTPPKVSDIRPIVIGSRVVIQCKYNLICIL